MKSPYQLSIAVTTCLLAAVTLSAQSSDERDLARKNLATQSAARFLATEMEALSAGDEDTLAFLQGALEQTMLENVEAHQVRQSSRNLALDQYQALLRDKFQERLEAAVELGRLQSPLPVSEAEVLARLGPGAWESRQQSALLSLTNNQFAPIFDDARLRAVLLQRYRLETGVSYPEFETLDERLTALLESAEGDVIPPAAFQGLSSWLGSFDESSAGLVFEEIANLQRDAVGQKLLQIQGQYNRQIGLVDEVGSVSRTPASAVRVGDIANFLIGHVESQLPASGEGQSDATAGAPVYPVFSATKAYAVAVAGRIEAERLSGFLDGLALRSPSPARLASQIEENLDQHRDPEASFMIFRNRQAAQIIPEVASQFADQSDARNSRQLAGYIRQRMSEESPLRAKLLEKVDESLRPAFEAARERVVTSQLETFFPIVATNAPLPESLVQNLYFLSSDPKQGTTYEKVLNTFRQVPELGSQLVSNPDIIDETKQAVVDYYDQAAYSGVVALRRQMNAVALMEKENLDSLRRQVSQSVPLETLEEQWMVAFERKWRGDSVYNTTTYQAPFEMATDAVKKAVRQFYTSTDEIGPPPPPGELPNLVFLWDRDEYRELQIERERWRRRYEDQYEEYQAQQEVVEQEREAERLWITPTSRTRSNED